MRTPDGKLRVISPAETAEPRLPSGGGLDTLHTSTVYGTPEEQINYFLLLRRHRHAVMMIFGLCALAGVLYAFLAPKSYKAQAVLEVTGINQDFMNTRDADPYGNGVTPDSYLETQIMLLKNEAVVDRVVKGMMPKIPSSLASDDASREGLVRSVMSNAKAKEEGMSNLIRVSLIGPDPHLVADTANEWANQYIQQGQNARLNAASETGTFLKQQLEDAKHKLQEAGNALQEYARASGIVLTSGTQEPVAAEHLREIQQGLAQAEVDRANRQSAVEMAQNAAADTLPQVVDDPTIREDGSKLTELRRQLADLSTTLTPSNYKVQKVEAQIKDLEAEMLRRRSIIVHRLSVEDGTAARRQQLLKQQYDRQLAVATDQGSKQVRFDMLKHEVDVNEQVYQSMLQKAKEAGVIAALRAANARVVSPAKASLIPTSPKLSICITLATLLGIVLSLLYILIAERKDNSVRNPGETEQYVDRPELAVIPRSRLLNKSSKALARGALKLSVGSKEVHPMLEHWKKADKTFLTETYRSAGISILFSRHGPVIPRVLLVTSPHPRCGKTITIANLAISLAESGQRVLLIDGDLRRPALPLLFGVKNIEGLANALNEAECADLDSLIQTTAFPGVSILTSGNAKDNVTRLLHSSRLAAVLRTVRSGFDFVLIDAPPLLGLADARILGKFADGVIFICRAGRTSGDDLTEARRLLAEDGTYIIGTILNDYDSQREGSSHYESYLSYVGKTSA
jgi:capsular exopolysaccharide synthesis family protein